MPKLNNYFNVQREVEASQGCSTKSEVDINVPRARPPRDVPPLDEDSIEDCTDKNDSEPRVSPPRDMPVNENLNEDWINMNEPGVSPSRDVLEDEASTDPAEIFRVQCFNVIVDRAIVSMNERFQQLKNRHARFSVVLQFSKLSQSELIKQCRKLEMSLRDGEDCDTDGRILADKLDGLESFLPLVVAKSPINFCSICMKTNLLMCFLTPVSCFVSC